MKRILICALLAWPAISGYSQTDTTKKPVDSLGVPIDTTRVSLDSVRVDAVINNITARNDRNEPVYRIKPAIDIPVTLAATAWSVYGFSQIYNKPSSPESRILSLRASDVNSFDRRATRNYSPKASDASDLFFYGSMPMPFLLLADNTIRKDAFKVLFLYWETMAVTGIFYTGTAYIVDRYRPFVYNAGAPMHEKTNGNAKNSFLGGHPALVATSTFFIAKVFSDYHPDSKLKWVFYTAAAGATATTAYLRYRAGKHFPSDLIVGTTIGTLTGILVPHFHKNKLIKNPNISIRPFSGESHGFVFVYKFK